MKRDRADLYRKVVTGVVAFVVGGLWYLIWTRFQFMSSDLFWVSWLVLMMTINYFPHVARLAQKVSRQLMAWRQNR
ncbi:hypothetical protein [Lacticaseibacillus absianus]|uniref:hypothetical protein n=1 Tax=Lacticaseibacillus absianus TaxID=2729623 RepID=UPI0015C9974D|nr:hypothetical protein [Lacticaseibacillus absianus]